MPCVRSLFWDFNVVDPPDNAQASFCDVVDYVVFLYHRFQRFSVVDPSEVVLLAVLPVYYHELCSLLAAGIRTLELHYLHLPFLVIR